jgi:hypothetical protein
VRFGAVENGGQGRGSFARRPRSGGGSVDDVVRVVTAGASAERSAAATARRTGELRVNTMGEPNTRVAGPSQSGQVVASVTSRIPTIRSKGPQ